MKKYVVRAVALCIVVFAMGLLAGCETWKGFCRDVKDADAWMQENLW